MKSSSYRENSEVEWGTIKRHFFKYFHAVAFVDTSAACFPVSNESRKG